MPSRRPLPPVTRRVVSGLLLLAAVLLALGILLQLGITLYLGVQQGAGSLNWSQLGALALGLATAAVLGYYGWQLRRPDES